MIATEDQNFYNHWGVSPWAIFRSFITNLLHFFSGPPKGGSTITQQLARNLYKSIGFEQTLFRKIREAITAVEIEKRYTKDEILMMYLNVASFGRGAYGIQAATQTYFGKRPNQLSLSESAFLVGLLKAPRHYDPRYSYKKSIQRRNTVLALMKEEGYITHDEFLHARKDSLVTFSGVKTAGIAPSFVEHVRKLLREKAEKYGFNLYRDGLSIYTSLDTRMQEYANRAVWEHLQDFQKLFDTRWNWNTPKNRILLAEAVSKAAKHLPAYAHAGNNDDRQLVLIRARRNRTFVDSVKRELTRIQVGFVAINPHTGYIEAMVGNAKMNFKYGLNHVTQIRRQPGSTFKPFIYLVALDNGYPASMRIPNEPFTFEDGSGKVWSPRNFGGETGGTYSLREGLAKSLNIITARVILEFAPPDEVVRYASRMGIESPLRPYASLALGTSEVTPLELTAAYGAMANEGIYVQPVSILRIEDRNGNLIEEHQPEVREVLSKETAFLITSMLETVIKHGTGVGVRRWFTLPAAGKTGTTQNYGDAWFVGFTPDLVAGTWIGFDDQRVKFTGAYGQGSKAALPIWARFMKYVYQDKRLKLPARGFTIPTGIVKEKICVETGNLAGPFCPITDSEYFNAKYLPGVCTQHTDLSSPPSNETKTPLQY